MDIIEIIKKFKNNKILVLGDTILDKYLFSSVDRISPEAPVPVAHVEKETNVLGGAANVAHNAKTLGTKVIYFSAIGDDKGAREVIKQFQKKT